MLMYIFGTVYSYRENIWAGLPLGIWLLVNTKCIQTI